MRHRKDVTLGEVLADRQAAVRGVDAHRVGTPRRGDCAFCDAWPALPEAAPFPI